MAMYEENYTQVKLDKGMYHLANKSFLQALEAADASAAYAGTPLADTDAYERQLKRFDIRVSGAYCDKVEKFFTTTESAVLFPEFVRRAVMQGMEEAVLSEITAVVSRCESNRYQGCVLDDSTAYANTAAGSAMPISTIMESSSVITIQKYGRVINASYEAVRQQRLDVFALMLRRVGSRLADSITKDAITTLKNAVTSSASTTVTTLSYENLAALYGGFSAFRMRAMLASPATVANILTMEQMIEASSQDVTEIRLPFGTKLINCPQMADNMILGVDTDFALEQIQSSDVILETDKIIDRQLDCISVSVNIGFRALMADAVRKITISG